MDFINQLINNTQAPIVIAFLLGILTSISPCPLATNITAIAFISKEITESKKVLISGLIYTLGRAFSYTLLAILIFTGFSAINIQGLFQKWGDKVLGPLLILIGLVMLDVIKVKLTLKSNTSERFNTWLKNQGYLGSFILGALFALAFCPYSGVVFFGMLIPLIISSNNPVFAPIIFSLGTGLPVIIFAYIIAFSANKIGSTYNSIKTIEAKFRKATAIIFILIGIYYLQYLVLYLLGK